MEELNNLEKNVLLVALDHMEEHLNDIGEEIEVSDKLKALESLKNKIHKLNTNTNG